jgi:PAS domain S-box-containing protein
MEERVTEGRRTILLVEDEAIIALSERKALEKYGYGVITVLSGEEAIADCESNGAIDLVLIDIDLGSGIDGVETATRILRRRTVPIVFLSSHSEPEYVERTESIASYGYIVKNSNITILDAAIKMAFKLSEANQKIKAATDRVEAMLETLPDLLFEVGLDGYYYNIYSSHSHSHSLYRPAKEVIGKSVRDILPATQAEIVMSAIAEANEEGHSVGKQYELSTPAGISWFEVSVSRLGAAADMPHFILLRRDITKRKQIEIELITSNKMFQAVLDSIPQYICWKDRNSMFLGCNKNHLGLFDLPDTESIIGKTDWELHQGKEEIEKFIKDDRDVMENDAPKYHIIEKAYYPNGKQRWLETNKVPLHDAEGNVYGIMIAYSDITEKKELEDSLAKEQYLLDILMANCTDYIYFKDLEGRYIMNSKAHASFLGLSDPSEMAGKTDFDFYTREYARQAYDDEMSIMKTGAPCSKEEKETVPNRPDAWALTEKQPLRDKVGNIIGTFGISRDVTERKRAQEALKESNERYRGIIERISDYIFTVYCENGDIVRTVHNPACIAVTGYTAEEFALDPYLWFKMILPEDRDRVARHAERILSDELSEAIEHRIRRKDGTLRWIRNTPVQHRDAGGEVACYDGIIVDITERKLAEEEIQKLLGEKELILKEVHHRIKNNMNTITSLLNLQASTLTEPEAITALKDAGSRVQSMMVLYDKLYQTSSFTDVSIKEYFPPLAERIIGDFPNSHTVRIETEIEDFVLGVGVMQPLGIIINELLTNIMKYAFIGREDGLIRLSVSSRGAIVEVMIQDDGNTIPEGIDFTSSPGFGLMLVKSLTEQLRGNIRIERGKGTKIILEFER